MISPALSRAKTRSWMLPGLLAAAFIAPRPALAQKAPAATVADAASPATASEDDPFAMLRSREGLEQLFEMGAGDDSSFRLGSRRLFSTGDRRDIETEALFFTGSYQFAAKNYKGALETFQKAEARAPENSTILVAMADAALGLEEPKQAAEICERLLKRDPDNVNALLLKGRAEDAMGRNLQAIESLERVRKFQPNNVRALGELGLLYFKIVQWEKGIEAFEKLVSIRPNDIRGLLYLCFGHRVSGNPDKAVHYADEALDYFPSLPQAHELKLAALGEARRWDEYDKELRNALTLVPASELETFLALFHSRILRDLASQGELEELGARLLRDASLREATAVLALAPGGAETHPFNLELAARLSEALLPSYEQFAQEYPYSHRPRLFLAHLSERAGRRRDAIDEYREAIRVGANKGDALERIARQWQALGRLDEAFKAFEEAREAEPLRGSPYLGLGELREDLAAYSEAAGFYAKGLALEPQNVQLAIALGRALRRAGDIDRSIEALNDSLVAIKPAQPELYRELAFSFEAQGSLGLAARNMVRAAEAAPADFEPRFKLLELQLALDDPEAMKTLENLRKDFAMPLTRSLYDSRRLARLLMRFGQTEAALDLVNGLAKDAETPPAAAAEALAEIAGAVQDEKEREAVRQTIEKLTSRFRNVVARNSARSRLLAALGDAKEAEQDFRRALRHDWMEPELVYARLAQLLIDQDDPDGALKVLDEAAASLGEKVPSAQRDLAPLKIRALAEAGRLEEARQEAVAFVERVGPGFSVLNGVAGVFHGAGDIETAERFYREALEAAPENAMTLNNLAYMFADANIRLDEAETLARQALELNPGAGFILDTLGWTLYRRGDYQGALNLIRTAASVSDADAEVFGHLGAVLAATGDKAGALLYWRQAARMDPDNAEIAAEIAALEAK
jgi:tetratricopeptide (TPR) repeat protein